MLGIGKRSVCEYTSAAKTSWSLRIKSVLESCLLRTHRPGGPFEARRAPSIQIKDSSFHVFSVRLLAGKQTEKDCGIVQLIYGWDSLLAFERRRRALNYAEFRRRLSQNCHYLTSSVQAGGVSHFSTEAGGDISTIETGSRPRRQSKLRY